MSEVPMTGVLAEYQGRRYRVLFSGDDWVALGAAAETELPDAFDRGESPAGQGHYNPWAKVPRTALDGVVSVVTTASLHGHAVSLRRRLPDGRIDVEFIGPPAVAEELGLDGDQYMGWTGLFEPDAFEDVHVEETRRV